MKWFRVYADIKDDPKVLELDFEQRWIWLSLLAMASDATERGSILFARMRGLAAALRCDEGTLTTAMELLVDLDMIHVEDGRITITHWDDRQYDKPSDVPESTRDRKRRSRASHADVTPSHAIEERRGDTETDTETETEGEDEAREALPAAAVQTASVLCQSSWIGGDEAAIGRAVGRAFGLVPAFSQQDGPLEAEKFARYHARQPPKDWYRAWLNWLKNAVRYADHAPVVARRRGRIPDYDGINAVADAMTREGL